MGDDWGTNGGWGGGEAETAERYYSKPEYSFISWFSLLRLTLIFISAVTPTITILSQGTRVRFLFRLLMHDSMYDDSRF